jgi:hypothetical protein
MNLHYYIASDVLCSMWVLVYQVVTRMGTAERSGFLVFITFVNKILVERPGVWSRNYEHVSRSKHILLQSFFSHQQRFD